MAEGLGTALQKLSRRFKSVRHLQFRFQGAKIRMKYLRDLINFLKAVAADTRIPERDKVVLTALIALVLSPFDIIPDWIPFFGLLDDIIILAVVSDYFFNLLDQQLLLSHWPWGMKSFVRIRRGARVIAKLVPTALSNRIWAYKPKIYE